MSSYLNPDGTLRTSTSINYPHLTILGHSSDTKPSATTYAGYIFLEIDTGNAYWASAGQWDLLVPSSFITQQNYGTSTQNGGSRTFTIAHGLASTPNLVNVQAKSADALGPFFITADPTYITVTYGVATPTGTNNVSLWWEAKI